ncbi:MAG: hypothetical protein M1840_008531 [Geoglossum simile]|nr:MAG: hypothetical protein M1840_008531 [Geoglossum simile]
MRRRSDLTSGARVLQSVWVLIAAGSDVCAMILTAPPAEPSLQDYIGLLKGDRLRKRDSTEYCAGRGAGQACWYPPLSTLCDNRDEIPFPKRGEISRLTRAFRSLRELLTRRLLYRCGRMDRLLFCVSPMTYLVLESCVVLILFIYCRSSCAVRTTCIPYTKGATPSCDLDQDGCLPCNSDRPNCVYQTNIKMSQYIFYCDSVAPQTITLSFDNPATGSSLVTPPGWTSGKPPPRSTSTSTPTPTTISSAAPQNASSTSRSATPSPASASRALSPGIIAAISLAAIAVVAITFATTFWCFIRPWMKKRKGLVPQAFPQDASHDGTYPWETPDSVEPKPQERSSIPYPGDHTELPTNSPRFLAVDPEKYLDEKIRHSGVGSDGVSEGDLNSDSHIQSASQSRALSRAEMSPVSPTTPSLAISGGFPSPDRAGAVSPISMSSPKPKFKYLTPENALSGYTDDEEEEEEVEADNDKGFELELEGSPSFHTRNSMLRAEIESKRSSAVREESKQDSKRVEPAGGEAAVAATEPEPPNPDSKPENEPEPSNPNPEPENER